MKKAEWKAIARKAEYERADAERRVSTLEADIAKLKTELEVIRKNWRPVPVTHEWQPRNPQCALCDEPRAAARHNTLEGADLTGADL